MILNISCNDKNVEIDPIKKPRDTWELNGPVKSVKQTRLRVREKDGEQVYLRDSSISYFKKNQFGRNTEYLHWNGISDTIMYHQIYFEDSLVVKKREVNRFQGKKEMTYRYDEAYERIGLNVYKEDENGELTLADSTITEYNSNEILIKGLTFNSVGDLIEKTHSTKLENGHLLIETNSYKDGLSNGKEVIEFDQKGQYLRRTEYNELDEITFERKYGYTPEGKEAFMIVNFEGVWSKELYDYDENGFLTSTETLDSLGVMKSKTQNLYNDWGEVISEVQLDSLGQAEWEYTYERTFDHYNNMIQEIRKTKGDTSAITTTVIKKRIIEYYDQPYKPSGITD